MVPGSWKKTVGVLGYIHPCETKAVQDSMNGLSRNAECWKTCQEEAPVKRILWRASAANLIGLCCHKKGETLLDSLPILPAGVEQHFMFQGQLWERSEQFTRVSFGTRAQLVSVLSATHESAWKRTKQRVVSPRKMWQRASIFADKMGVEVLWGNMGTSQGWEGLWHILICSGY